MSPLFNIWSEVIKAEWFNAVLFGESSMNVQDIISLRNSMNKQIEVV